MLVGQLIRLEAYACNGINLIRRPSIYAILKGGTFSSNDTKPSKSILLFVNQDNGNYEASCVSTLGQQKLYIKLSQHL